MRISIVTPSFRNSEWLKLCIASVADQDVEHEHIVQDSCSDDGTQEWLSRDTRVKAFIEKDSGMYDAVNRGFRRCQGEILAYINCDEQYLPGALEKVLAYFDAHPETDVLFADTVVVNAAGDYICDRKALVPQKYHSLVSGNLAFLTCATFFRRRLLDQHNLFFNPQLRDLGDCDWALRLIQKRVRMGVLREFTSIFTETGVNMNLLPNAAREKKEIIAKAPFWARKGRQFIVLHFRMRRLLSGAYQRRPHEYAIFTKGTPERRRTFSVLHPTFRWIRPT